MLLLTNYNDLKAQWLTMHQKINTSHRYLKVKQFLLDGIRDQVWSTNEKIPSENELVQLCEVSRMTARRAVDELSKEGIIERIHGLGSFVKTQKTSSSFLEIKDIADEITTRGKQHKSHLLALELKQNTPLPGLKSNLIDCFYSEILHFENDSPIQFEARQINPEIAPDYLAQDFEKINPANYLLGVAPITKVNQIIEATIPDSRISSLLQMKPGEPCLVIERTTWSGENWATLSKFYHPGDRYQIGV